MVDPVFDLIIYRANVIDGSGSEGRVQDVAIIDDYIAKIGDLTGAQCVQSIDANGLTLAPGFIDVHTHDDIEVIRNPSMESKVSQGITTVIVGNCGISAAPAILLCEPPDPMNLLGQQHEFTFPHFCDYVVAVNDARPSVNVAALVGHTAIRNNVMDDLYRAATAQEIDSMAKQLRTALSQGAIGLSSGLAYATANQAPAAELETLARELKIKSDHGLIKCWCLVWITRTTYAVILLTHFFVANRVTYAKLHIINIFMFKIAGEI